jgi:hypothetical protein
MEAKHLYMTAPPDHMKRICVFLIIVLMGCISQQPPQFENCSPEDTVLQISGGESIEFSCTASDPDTNTLDYSWYVNDIEVSTTASYDFTMSPGKYTVMVEVSDGITSITYTWDVTVVGGLDFKNIETRLERIRGLKFSEPVKRVEIDRTQLRETLMTDLQEEYEDILKEKALYVALHVMDSEADLYQMYVDMLTSQVASYYDTGDHTFYEVLDPDEPSAFREYIAAHELLHALQDQHHYLDEEFDNDDQFLAYLCLVEGDAVFHQIKYLEGMTYLEKKLLFEYISTLDIPVVNILLENMLSLRYDLGYDFVTAMNFSGVDTLYESLPVSTEQVMHPEKYMAHELPIEVDIPLIPGWNELTTNTMGEAIMITILKEHISSEKAAEAAEGWGGDTYGYYQKGEDYLFILNTFWDTEEDAKEFYEAYYDFTLSWSNKSIKEIDEDIYETPTGFLALIQKNSQVIVIESSSYEAIITAMTSMQHPFLELI